MLGLLIGMIGDKLGNIDGVLTCVLLHVLTTAAILFYPKPIFLLFMAFFWGGASAFGPLINSAIGAIAPETSRAKWMSIPTTSSMTGAVIAPYLGGYLFENSLLPFAISLFATIPVTALALAKPFKEE